MQGGEYMKSWKVWISIFGALAIIAGVLFATPILGPSGSAADTALPNGDFIMYAGQTNEAGDGEVDNDCDYLYFTIDTECNYGCIKIEIWDDNSALPTNPSPGSFTYSHNCEDSVLLTGEINFQIPFNPGAWNDGDIVIAIHANTQGCNGVYSEDTAWACGYEDPVECLDFPGANWATYFWYDFSPCVE